MAAGTQVFAVIATRRADLVKAAVEKFPDEQYYEVKDDTWLVSYAGTTRQLAEHLGIRKGIAGSGLVILIASYSGRASSDLWEWLNAQMVENG